ncbi:SDR family NAD(P)-dependent oxidoreductase [Pedococcus sp. P5_B7]
MKLSEGLVALVTGAAGGLGAAASRMLANDGASIVLADVDGVVGEKTADCLRADGFNAIAHQLDVTSESAWARCVDTTIREFGRVDILVNNAGVGGSRSSDGQYPSIDQLDVEQWRSIIDVNLTGTFLGMKTVVPHFRNSGSGCIVNVSSIGGIKGTAVFAYATSKGAVRSLTKSAAVNLASAGIRANSLHPGVVRTAMTAVLLGSEAEEQTIRVGYPLGRIAEPQEIAQGVLYLASSRSSFLTGTELVIDGGITAT